MTSNKPTYSAYDRMYFADIFKSAVHSAFIAVIQYRKKHDGLTQKELSSRCGKDKTQISKLLSEPANWQIKTVSDLAFSLDVDVNITLTDKANPSRVFTPHGVTYGQQAPPRRTVQIIPAVATLAHDPQAALARSGGIQQGRVPRMVRSATIIQQSGKTVSGFEQPLGLDDHAQLAGMLEP